LIAFASLNVIRLINFTPFSSFCLSSCLQETVDFIAAFYPTWEVNEARGEVHLSGAKTTKSEEIPSLRLISQNLAYATELERIV